MKNSPKILFYIFIIIGVRSGYPASELISQEADTIKFSLQVGEELTYIVRYAFINLGEVKLQIKEETSVNGKNVIKTAAYMDSYEGLPFVDLHQIYNSYIDSSLFPLLFIGLMLEKDTNFVQYVFDGDSIIKITKGNYNTGEIRFDSVAKVNQKFQDGLSILYYARKSIGKETTSYIPCFVNEEEEITKINFYKENEPVEIDAVDYEIDCLRLDGETDFVSVYGLTGHFEGWFSNDGYSVPVLARMNVILGSVTLELKKWNKKIWNPPRYIE